MIESVARGDLLTAEVWECEGVEHPWGFRMEVLDGLQDLSGSQFRRLTRRPSVKVVLAPGEVCVGLRMHMRDHPTIDSFCEVLVRGMKLGVHTRFLHLQL
jgi:hypothetical protein